ncbi:MAG TPA: dihydrodipicolinate synthase family protein, partial [Chloroflexota bacterium]|nr:dihydrodipicolinate synthase family protein [Chloroflexota bacterium]
AAAARLIYGAVPVLAMPFDDDGAIDEDSLRHELDFCLEAGAQAVCFGMGSESSTLTDAERAQVWTLAARHLAGRVPLIAATAHASREGTLALTRLARESGVDCAMVNPQPSNGEQLVELFRRLSERIGLPLMVQDAGGNAPAPVLLRAAEEAPAVCSLKLESPGAALKMAAVAAGLQERGWLAGAAGTGRAPAAGGAGQEGQRREITILGGANGSFLPEELELGAVGTMPHPAIIDAFRVVCERYAAGEGAAGYEAYLRLVLPVLRAAGMAGAGDGGGTMLVLQKTLLQRAGVIRTAVCRQPSAPLPGAILERVLRHLDGAGAELLLARRLPPHGRA